MSQLQNLFRGTAFHCSIRTPRDDGIIGLSVLCCGGWGGCGFSLISDSCDDDTCTRIVGKLSPIRAEIYGIDGVSHLNNLRLLPYIRVPNTNGAVS